MVKISNFIKVALLLLMFRTILFVIKLIFGILINSLLLIADSINSGADMVIALGILIGSILSERKPSKKYPYGMYKIENLIELFISLAVFYIGYTILSEIFQNFEIIQTTNIELGLLISAICIGISISLMIFLSKKGKNMNSPMFIAESADIRMDILATTLVFIGISGQYFGFDFLELFMGIFLAILVFITGLQIFIHSTKVLLDASVDYDKLNIIRNMIEKQPNVFAIERLFVRSAGRYYFLELNIKTHLKLVKKAQELRDEIEKEIKEEFPEISRIIIDIDLEKKEFTRYAIPLLDNEGLNSIISDHFGSAKYFLNFDLKDNKIINLNFMQNPYLTEEKRKGILVGNWLAAKSTDIILVKEPLKGGAKLALEKHLIEIKIIENPSIKEYFEKLGLNFEF